jgi:hypothetical protein
LAIRNPTARVLPPEADGWCAGALSSPRTCGLLNH